MKYNKLSLRKYQQDLSLKCFSPPVMIATFFIEITLAVYLFWRYKLNSVTRPAILILINLAIFQLAEFNICEGAFGIDSLSWSRLGYIAITVLPPLGFHLATRLAGDTKRNFFVGLAYLSGLAFAIFFAFSGMGITAHACLGNYVIFETAPFASVLYAIYYYGWLIVGTTYSFIMSKKSALNQKSALIALAIGYLAFILPTTTANIIDPSTIAGIPSIMCGFAVLLAIILAGRVLPQYFKKTN